MEPQDLERAYAAGDNHVHGLQLVFSLGQTNALTNLNQALANSLVGYVPPAVPDVPGVPHGIVGGAHQPTVLAVVSSKPSK